MSEYLPPARAEVRASVLWVTLFALGASAGADDHLSVTPTDRPPQAQIAPAVVRLSVSDASDVRFSHLSRSQGLSQTRVTRIVQDDQGFIWFGTQYGLNRYDGYRFKVFKHDPDDSLSTCGVDVQSLFKDRRGTLWKGCDHGLDRYDPAREAFVHYRIDPEATGLSVSVKHISQDSADMLWLSTRNGLYRFDPRSGTTTHFRHQAANPSSLSSDEVLSTGEDRSGAFWVATTEGLDEFDRAAGRVILHVPIPEPRELSFYEDRSGIFWVLYGSGNGLAILDRQKRELTRYSFGREELPDFPLTGVSAMLEDHGGTLWIGTFSDGLLKFDREHRQFIRYRNDPTNSESLSEDRVTTLTEDREGTVWVGSGATEPSFFSTAASPFTKLPFDWRNPANLGEKLINTLYADREGFLWIGTTGALNRLDRATGEEVRFAVGELGFASDVLSIVEDRQGNLWVGTSGQGLARLDRRTGRITMYRHIENDNSSLSNNAIPALFVDRQGTLWAGTFDGLDKFDAPTGRFTSYRHSAQGRAAAYQSIDQGPNGALWVGSDTVGLLRFDPDTHEFKVFSKPLLYGVQAHAVHVARTGIVWAGTQDGLSGLDPETGVVTNYSEKDGLASNSVSCILEDSDENLWMGTTAGLSRLTPRTRTFKNYSFADGLPGLDLTGWSACTKNSSGEMFFGGFAGGLAFRPDRVTDSVYVPPVVLTEFDLFGVPVVRGSGSPLQRAIDFADTLTLAHDQNSLAFEFSALSFRSPVTNRYRYKLEGLDTAWHEVGSDQRRANYTTLPPGNYVFRVQGATVRGPWGEPGRLVHISILPPWWTTWWFRAAAAAAILFAGWSVYRSHLRRIANQFELRLTERVRERTRIARDLHDTLLQSFQGLLLRFQTATRLLPTRPEEARQVLESTMDQAEEALADGRDAVQGLRSSATESSDLADTIKNLGEELAEDTARDRAIPITLRVEGTPWEVRQVVRDEIYRIAGEALRNALRHSAASRIEVTLDYDERQFELHVRDNGKGIDAKFLSEEGRGKHFGLSGMRERAAMIGGRLTLWTSPESGTELELKVPGSLAYVTSPRRLSRFLERLLALGGEREL